MRTLPDDVEAGMLLKDLAYTPNALGFHTDNPYRHPVPSLQLLHAIKHCTCGPQPASGFPCGNCSVVNSFVDAFAMAERLEPRHFDVLAATPVRFENNGGDGTSALWHTAPVLELKPVHRADVDASGLVLSVPAAAAAGECGAGVAVEAGTCGLDAVAGHYGCLASPPQPQPQPCRRADCLSAVRFSAKSGGYAPLHLGPARLAAFYEARRAFSRMAHDEAFGMQFQMQLEAGDVVVFDNARLLHARSSVAPTDGERYLQVQTHPGQRPLGSSSSSFTFRAWWNVNFFLSFFPALSCLLLRFLSLSGLLRRWRRRAPSPRAAAAAAGEAESRGRCRPLARCGGDVATSVAT